MTKLFTLPKDERRISGNVTSLNIRVHDMFLTHYAVATIYFNNRKVTVQATAMSTINFIVKEQLNSLNQWIYLLNLILLNHFGWLRALKSWLEFVRLSSCKIYLKWKFSCNISFDPFLLLIWHNHICVYCTVCIVSFSSD